MNQEPSNPTVLLRVPLEIAEQLREISREQHDHGLATSAETLLTLIEAVNVYAMLADNGLDVEETSAVSAMFSHYRFLKELSTLDLQFIDEPPPSAVLSPTSKTKG